MHDRGEHGNLRPAQAVRIPVSIRLLVVQFDDLQYLRWQAQGRENRGADGGVPLDLRELLVAERARLPQHRIGYADLADVVQQRAQAQHVELATGEAEFTADHYRERRDPFGVTGRVAVTGVERRGQGADDAQIRRFGLGLRALDGMAQGVERAGQVVELATGAGGHERVVEAALARHLGEAAAQLVDGADERAREPGAAQAGEQQRAEADGREHGGGVGRGGARGRAHRTHGVDRCAVDHGQPPHHVLVTAGVERTAGWQTSPGQGRSKGGGRRAGDDAPLEQHHHVGVRLGGECACVGVVEWRGQDEFAHDVAAEHERHDRGEIDPRADTHRRLDGVSVGPRARLHHRAGEPVSRQRTHRADDVPAGVGHAQCRHVGDALHLDEFPSHGVDQLVARPAGAVFRLVGVHGGLEGWTLGERRRLRQALALAAGLDVAESLLAQLEVLGDGRGEASARLP